MASSGSIRAESASSSAGVNVRAWVFRVLTLAGAAALLYTWYQPWWVAYIEELQQNGVIIYPNAMVFSGMLRNYPQWLVGAEMPPWFFPAMWVYLGTCITCLLGSLFFNDEWFEVGKLKLKVSQALIGFAGLAYIIFVVVFPIVVAIRAPEFNGVPLQGSVFVSMNEHTESYVVTSLQTGYWIACTVGPFLALLALLRNRIVGKS